MAEFDRENPLFQRNVPFEIVSNDGTKSNEQFTVRILQGHRGKERVFRFEMSDECNLVKTTPDFQQTACRTPINNRRSSGLNPHKTPHAPVIHAPFLTGDGGMDPISQRGYYDERGMNNAFNQLHLSRKSSAITNKTIQLFELEVGESDFDELRRDQALLVTFNDFSHSLISLMQCCWDGEDGDVSSGNPTQSCADATPSQRPEVQWGDSNSWNQQHTNATQNYRDTLDTTPYKYHQHGIRYSSPYDKPPVSTYACRLQTSSLSSDNNSQWRKNGNVASSHARFSIVESNRFRELTHLALTLNVGTDKSTRMYLSSQLSQAMAQVTDTKNQLDLQSHRCEAAERNAMDTSRRLAEMAQAYDAEKYQLHCQAEQRFQAESSSKDHDITTLQNELQKCKSIFEEKIRVLEDTNKRITEDKSSCRCENERLSSNLNQQETNNQLLSNEVFSLKSQLDRITSEKASTEKNLRELQELLASVETTNNNQKNEMSQSVAQMVSIERVYADAKQTISRQHSQIDEMKRRITEAESEVSRYKELSGRYQVNRAEMKKSIKEKMERIRQQEEVIRSKETEVNDLSHRVQRLNEDLKRVQIEKDGAEKELATKKSKIDEDARKIENNQQVIAWLNRQLQSGKNTSSGVVWQENTPTLPPPTRHGSTAASAPSSNQVISSSLSRYLPNSSSVSTTPCIQQGVTPEIKIVSVQKPLHPFPHPL